MTNIEPIDEQINSNEIAKAEVEISADFSSCFTYASYQNAIPVLRSLSIKSNSNATIENCHVEMTSTPPFLRQKSWKIDRILPGDIISPSDRKVELDAGYLSGLNEAERGEIKLRLVKGNDTLNEINFSVRLLARDEWGGVNDMGQLLPAFVMPNDPAIATILRTAAEQLAAHGHSSGLDGYQSQDPQRAYMLAAAIYSAVVTLGLHYAEPPVSFEHRGQKIRRPTQIAEDRLATCLDTTLLFAASLEAAGLFPVVLMFEGHAATGVWLAKRTLSNTIEVDQMEVRKALASRELIVFETTAVTHRPPMTLEAAQKTLERRFSGEDTAGFVAAIDIHRARSGGVTPLASHEPLRRSTLDEEQVNITALPLPTPPAFNYLPEEIADIKPTTAAGRIDRWQKKLLDLTLRNRLLNFPDSKKSIPFLCTDVAGLEDRLADGAAIRIISLLQQNPLGERDGALYRDVHGKDIQQTFAAEALTRNELASTLDAKQLETRLIDLYRQVRNDFAEGGANTLFLAVGFLRWKKKPEDERSYRAPLLLVPVKLDRRSASSQFTMRYHEDEPRFNATLIQFLERDFDLQLPQFVGELPVDDSGIDVPRILAMMRQAVRDVPGMEVVDDTALSTFSFAKFLMWKDLVERTDALRQNRVVKHLIDSPEQAFLRDEERHPFCDEAQLDQRYSPADIVCLLPADSSQTAATAAAAEGRDFIIIGPPGTGKSQTIANMIANCLAAGKTVLFVAEKTAALDVVYRRLREHGLGNHCIELHSNKADRRQFLGQLKEAWQQNGSASLKEWVAINERLQIRRTELSEYVEALHKQYPNGWSAYLALGTALRDNSSPAPEFFWSERDAHDTQLFLQLEELSANLGLAYQSIERNPALGLINQEMWSAAWQEELLTSAGHLLSTIAPLNAATEDYLRVLDLRPQAHFGSVQLQNLLELATALKNCEGYDFRIALNPDFKQAEPALQALANAINQYRTAEAELSATYDLAALSDADLQIFDRQWREASAAFWPKSYFGKNKLQKILQSYVSQGQAAPAHDLSRLRQMKDILKQIAANPLQNLPLKIDGLQTNIQSVAGILQLSQELRSSLRIPGYSSDETKDMLRCVLSHADGTDEHDIFWKSGRDFIVKAMAFQTAYSQFASVARHQEQAVNDTAFTTLQDELERLIASRHLLRDWTSLCQIRTRAMNMGLSSLVDLLEQEMIDPENAQAAFRLGYARWWLPKVIDGDPVLRDFRRFQHENAIQDFREIDDLVRKHASQRVINAIAHGLPSIQEVPRNSELGLLRHQMELQRPSQSIRDMIGKMPQNFAKLAPCMLMSPLSIAQYLPSDQALFDVVIFDEASQITTWDAVGAIARAKQTIIVGDPKQLPPTNFFGRNEDDEDVNDFEKDMESILDEVKAAGIPVRDLKWHYRSRSESLIAFSNHHYYNNRLVTFPSPDVDDRAVSLKKVPDGIYDRGKSRTNRVEAETLVKDAVLRMNRWLSEPEESRPTLGVITFNTQQQSLIQDLFDAARQKNPGLEWFFSEDRIEPVIVKNLENVQGDERDVILFSITFWKDSANKITMDFGALNRDGGERRLNVAITRARQELVVYSGFTADQIDLNRTKAQAVKDLKTFLDYAERGAIALPSETAGSVGGFDSPFEEAVAEQLKQRGWHIVPQIGISGFRIDLGIRHPDLPGRYLAGVECDGATYHSSATARDRDKVRQQVLEGLGWDILRVWSTDWWFDLSGCAERLNADLSALLEKSRAQDINSDPAENGDEAGPASDMPKDTADTTISFEDPLAHLKIEVNEATMPIAEIDDSKTDSSDVLILDVSDETHLDDRAATEQDNRSYRITNLSQFEIDPEQFFESGYRAVLNNMIRAVMEVESPLRTDILAQRIARAHGWQRTGVRIRDQIDAHLKNYDRTTESSGEFIWKKGTILEVLPYRNAVDETDRRLISDIPLAELTSVVFEHPELVTEDDPAKTLARLLGVERLTTSSRGRLEEAISRYRQVHTLASE